MKESIAEFAATKSGSATLVGASVSTTGLIDQITPLIPIAGLLIAVLGLGINWYYKHKTYVITRNSVVDNSPS